MQVLICPICGSNDLFYDPEDDGRVRCMNPRNVHRCIEYGQTVEIIPLATPQELR